MVLNGVRFATIPELRERLQAGDLSAAALAGEVLALLGDEGPSLNAVATLTPERAMAEAEAADRAMAAGHGGPLTGIPWGAKDLLATNGIPTQWGAPPFRGQTFPYDAAVVARLSAVGATLAAKLAMVELAGAGLYRWANASTEGACRNPWDRTRWAGGSSSGSAAAVAAGLVPFAIGSETGGSLVIPAAFCGVTAIRPSLGAVSRHGCLMLGWSLDKLGPVAHTAADCAAVLSVISGFDDRDSASVPYTFVPSTSAECRIGVLRQSSDDPAVDRAFDDALEVLSGIGCRLREVELPAIDFRDIHDRLFAGETLAANEEFIRGPRLAELIDQAQQDALTEYTTRSPGSYPRAAEERVWAVRAIRAMFEDVDVLVAPTVLTEAVAVDEDLLAYRGGRRGGNMFLGSIAGLPELTVPMGSGSNDLPVSLSLMGDLLRDADLLRLGELYQRETSWHVRQPGMEPST
jgi:aspartyl-tRNA(Asn)/glutamyl-tRNA(Gln) amidotransferase subunit A